jgi:hypothetical protein
MIQRTIGRAEFWAWAVGVGLLLALFEQEWPSLSTLADLVRLRLSVPITDYENVMGGIFYLVPILIGVGLAILYWRLRLGVVGWLTIAMATTTFFAVSFVMYCSGMLERPYCLLSRNPRPPHLTADQCLFVDAPIFAIYPAVLLLVGLALGSSPRIVMALLRRSSGQAGRQSWRPSWRLLVPLFVMWAAPIAVSYVLDGLTSDLPS